VLDSIHHLNIESYFDVIFCTSESLKCCHWWVALWPACQWFTTPWPKVCFETVDLGLFVQYPATFDGKSSAMRFACW